MITDAHCHAGLGDGLTGPWDTRAPLGDYLRRADRAGIGHTILLPAFHSDYQLANRMLARIVHAGAGRFTGFAMVHADRDAGRVARLIDTAVNAYGFQGIKVHRHDARISREVCESARAHGLPVLYDVMGDTAQIELLAAEYPEVRFIIPHLGSFADDWRAHTCLIDQLVRYPNIYADTSGVRRFDYLVQAVKRAGPEKLIFGSDGPFLHPALELAKVRALGLAPAAERMVTGGTITRILAQSGRHSQDGVAPRNPYAILATGTQPAVPASRPRPADPWSPAGLAAGQ
ncbi:MAG TPA: amidohydrolase family protein [Streptosporangiaceae bacterium]|nr:amidohydrolase family protein [Streptosporangiaceae bacterium]